MNPEKSRKYRSSLFGVFQILAGISSALLAQLCLFELGVEECLEHEVSAWSYVAVPDGTYAKRELDHVKERHPKLIELVSGTLVQCDVHYTYLWSKELLGKDHGQRRGYPLDLQQAA
jgi:hypothetical protein